MLQPNPETRTDSPEGLIFLPEKPSLIELQEAFLSLRYEPRELLCLMKTLYSDQYLGVSDRLKFALLQGRGLESDLNGEAQLESRGNHYDAILELEV